MDFSKLNPDILREMIKLTELKSSLQQQLAEIDEQLGALFSGKPVKKAKVAATGKRRGRPPGNGAAKAPKVKAEKAPKVKAPKGSGRRGALKGQILDLLSAAGPEGASVKDISEKLGVKNQNVHVWFSTTGKKLPEISKVGEARYAYKAAASEPVAEAPQEHHHQH
jgi:uncharacterized protein YjcR